METAAAAAERKEGEAAAAAMHRAYQQQVETRFAFEKAEVERHAAGSNIRASGNREGAKATATEPKQSQKDEKSNRRSTQTVAVSD